MRLIQSPNMYDVLVTANLFGDILTDEASVISGSMGLMPSASIGLETSLYEPIHGSYPQAAGKNVANPIATILSAAMMFEQSFKLNDESNMIKKAVNLCINESVLSEDLVQSKDSYSTSEIGTWISEKILSLNN